jgi:N-acetylglucosaminyl-diphospho-decaprenol L-rhamnosyltransferase
VNQLLSIVSHYQGDLVFNLLKDLQRFCSLKELEVVVTLNNPEKIHFKENDFNFRVQIHENLHPKGFAANHNTAFKTKNSDFFGVLNPDLRLTQDPFTLLTSQLTDKKTGVIAPLILDGNNYIEDSARRLPTPYRLVKRNCLGKSKSSLDYAIGDAPFFPDWVAGIFMFFRSTVFAEVKGFDERYRLYFEDVDLCSRLRLAGYKIILDPRVSVVHNARRTSHKNLRYLKWHISSGMRFFSSRVFWASWFQQFRRRDNKHIWT